MPWMKVSSTSRLAIHSSRGRGLRLVFPPGAVAWLRVNLLLLRLRARAFFAGIPLDLYAYDDPGSLRRFDQREQLLILLDRDGRLKALFPARAVPWPG